MLSERVGLGAGVHFEIGDALDLQCADERFDAVVVVHVGMNIPDKASLVAELHRVAKPGAVVVIYDIVRLTEAPLTYPMPWATSQSMDFVARQDAYEDAMHQRTWRSRGRSIGQSWCWTPSIAWRRTRRP